MNQTLKLFTSTLKMLIRDKTAFLMSLVFPVVFVLAFAVFDVSFSADGALPGVDYFDYVLPGLLALSCLFPQCFAADDYATQRQRLVTEIARDVIDFHLGARGYVFAPSPALAVLRVVVPLAALRATVAVEQYSVAFAHLAVEILHTQLLAAFCPGCKILIGREEAIVWQQCQVN